MHSVVRSLMGTVCQRGWHAGLLMQDESVALLQEGVVKIADFGLSRSLAIMQHRRPHGESVGASKRVRITAPPTHATSELSLLHWERNGCVVECTSCAASAGQPLTQRPCDSVQAGDEAVQALSKAGSGFLSVSSLNMGRVSTRDTIEQHYIAAPLPSVTGMHRLICDVLETS
jgi:hypothetical protein